MPRTLLLCVTISAVFHLGAAVAAAEDAAAPPAALAAARMLGMEPDRDRARLLSELVRLLYTPPPGRSAAARLLVLPDAGRELAGAESAMSVPVPLSAEVWSTGVFRRPITSDQLVGAILVDRSAALLSYGLSALDDETLAFFARAPHVLTELHARSAPAFAAFGASVRVSSGRVVPPGGDAAIPLWEAIVGQSVSDPGRFVPALFFAGGGRIAYLYDTIAQLEPASAAFALGSWIEDPAVRLDRFRALAIVCISAYREWRIEITPFSKPLHDVAIMLLRARVEPSGAPAAPSRRMFWTRVFEGSELSLDDVPPTTTGAGEAGDDLVDAAWLAQHIASDPSSRGERLDQFAFGQRVFADVPEAAWPEVGVAVRAFPRYPMLMLTLERIGVTNPGVYAAAARHARRLTGGDSTRAFWRLAQFQSAVALVARMAGVGTIDAAQAEALLVSACAVPLESNDRYAGGMALWLERELLPLLPQAAEIEQRVIAGLAGRSRRPAARVSWEGQDYRLDFAHAERRRLELVRQKQAGPSIDRALALNRVARALAPGTLAADELRAAAADLASLGEAFAPRPGTRVSPVTAPGVQWRDSRRVIAGVVGELTDIVDDGRDVRRAARAASPLFELVDTVLGTALLSMAYAAHLGDPDGSALLASNVALRHDFGFARRDGETRARTPWSIPRQDFQLGVPWHVTGSVLGLDLALAPMSLRRLSMSRTAAAPRLPPNERDAFAVGLVLMNPARLRDADADAVAAAVDRGRRRVLAAAAGRESLDAVADAGALDGWRRRAIGWMGQNDPEAIPSMFSLVELLRLGGVGDADLSAWGTTALHSDACACTRLVPPRYWRLLSGRPQIALMASAMADLNLHVAITLRELGVPAALAHPVLAAAVQDFIEQAPPTDANDWWSLVRAARAMPRDVIEDYVAAAAAVDGPLVPADSASEP